MVHKKQLARDTHNKDPRTVVDGRSVLELLRIVWSHSQSTSHKRLGMRPGPNLHTTLSKLSCV